MDEWYNHPETKSKIMNSTGSDHAEILNKRIADKTYATGFENHMNKIENFIQGKPRVHRGNSGVSGYNLDFYSDTSRRQNLVDKYMDAETITSTAIHEGNHGLTDGNRFIYDYDYTLQSPFNLDNYKERLPDGSYEKYEDYLLDPTEINARLSEIRYENKLTPKQILTVEDINNIIDKGLNGKSMVDSAFYKLIKDRDNFTWMMNKVPAAIPVTVGLGAASQMQGQPQFQEGGVIKDQQEELLEIKPSKIAGNGVFTKKEFPKGAMIGLAHTNSQPSTDLGRFHNHSENPNTESILIGNSRYLLALRPLKQGEEITTDYRKQPELEQPEDFKI
jgi:hypothetical protein